MKRAIVLIVDSLGIGTMEDYREYRKEDENSNTFMHILDKAEYMSIPNFEKLGINKLLNHDRLKNNSSCIQGASQGIARLTHSGADSYMGHQEIMGSKPIEPLLQAFSTVHNEVAKYLIEKNYDVKIINGSNPCLLVNDYVVVADNIETDFGQIYNITAPLDFISFDEVLKIGQHVRSIVKVSRVIALGGSGITIDDILGAIETKPTGATGVNCPKSGVYKKGYMVKHMGYGINPEKQSSSILIKNNIDVTLIGKMADVIYCEGAKYVEAIETDRVMCEVLNAMDNTKVGLISATVQETDLSGHSQDVDRYATKVNTVDVFLGKILENMADDDLLIISADHGNDPTIGHSYHTREKTFILSYRKGSESQFLGERKTLSDIGATVCKFFNVEDCENGTAWGI